MVRFTPVLSRPAATPQRHVLAILDEFPKGNWLFGPEGWGGKPNSPALREFCAFLVMTRVAYHFLDAVTSQKGSLDNTIKWIWPKIMGAEI